MRLCGVSSYFCLSVRLFVLTLFSCCAWCVCVCPFSLCSCVCVQASSIYYLVFSSLFLVIGKRLYNTINSFGHGEHFTRMSATAFKIVILTLATSFCFLVKFVINCVRLVCSHSHMHPRAENTHVRAHALTHTHTHTYT